MAYAVKRLVGPRLTLCSLCYLSTMQSARSPSLPARACWLKMAVAVESSGPFLSLRLARLLATSRSLPGRRPYRHGPASQDGIAVESSGTPAWPHAPLDLLPKARSLPESPSLPARACAAS